MSRPRASNQGATPLKCEEPPNPASSGPPWLKPRAATIGRRQSPQRNHASRYPNCSVRFAGPRSPRSAASSTAPRRAAKPRGSAATPHRWKSPNPLSHRGSDALTSPSTSVRPVTPATTASNGVTTATNPAPASASRHLPPLRRTRRDIRPARQPHNQQHPLTCNTTRVGTFDEQHWGFSISGIKLPSHATR